MIPSIPGVRIGSTSIESGQTSLATASAHFNSRRLLRSFYTFVHQTGINEGKVEADAGTRAFEEERINGCERQVSQLGNFRVHGRPRPIPVMKLEAAAGATWPIAPPPHDARTLLPNFPHLP